MMKVLMETLEPIVIKIIKNPTALNAIKFSISSPD